MKDQKDAKILQGPAPEVQGSMQALSPMPFILSAVEREALESVLKAEQTIQARRRAVVIGIMEAQDQDPNTSQLEVIDLATGCVKIIPLPKVPTQ